MMKTAYIFILLAIILSIDAGVHESAARVALSGSLLHQDNEVVTGIYQGYQNQTIILQLKEGTRRAYPFKSDKSLLRRISKTKLSTRVRISIANGIVVRFEEASK